MKTLNSTLLAVFLFLIYSCSTSSNNSNTVNAVLGDVSYQQVFGTNPTTNTNENLRISTHLNYVLDKLKQADVSKLSTAQLESRLQLISYLQEYIEAENFPQNFDHPNERKPCFIDKNGNICAMGYLIERTAGRDVAEYINSKYQYEYILKMHDPVVSDWITQSGLSKEECAMIQPAYGFGSPGEVGLTYVLSAANTVMSVTNGIQLISRSNDRFAPIAGITIGTSQIVHGIAQMPARLKNPSEKENYDRKLDFALTNIGIGTVSLALGTINLLDNEERNKPKLNLDVRNIYVPYQESVPSLTLSKRF